MLFAAVVIGHPVVWSARLLRPKRNVDDFPLSTFPMFARRPNQVMAINHVVIFGGPNHGRTVPYHYWTRGGMNQARGQINRAWRDKVRHGKPKRIQSICERAAKRVARRIERGDERWEGAQLVAVVRSRYDVDAYFEQKREGEVLPPITRRSRHRCPVKREDEPRG